MRNSTSRNQREGLHIGKSGKFHVRIHEMHPSFGHEAAIKKGRKSGDFADFVLKSRSMNGYKLWPHARYTRMPQPTPKGSKS